MLTEEQKIEAQLQLDNYRSQAEAMANLDDEIRAKLNDFDLQAKAVDPISTELLALARVEGEQAWARIDQINLIVTILFIATIIIGVLLAIIIANILRKAITQRIITLTKVANSLQAGQLNIVAPVESQDEIGQLGGAFNNMTDQLRTLVNSLEQQVAERTVDLTRRSTQLETAGQVARDITSVLDQ